jgi:hypothetical protein
LATFILYNTAFEKGIIIFDKQNYISVGDKESVALKVLSRLPVIAPWLPQKSA